MPVDVDLGASSFRIAGRSPRLEPILREAFASAGWSETRDDDFDLLWDLSPPTLARCREIDARQRHSRIWGLAHLRHREQRQEHLAWARLRLGPVGDRLFDFAPSLEEPPVPMAGPYRRCYVLVTSIDPLQAYVARAGAPADDAGVRRVLALSLVAVQRDVLAALSRDAVPHDAGFELLAFDIDERLRIAEVSLALPFADGEDAALERKLLLGVLRRVGVNVSGGVELDPLLPGEPDWFDAYELPRYEDVRLWQDLAPPPSLLLVPDGVVTQAIGRHLAVLDDKTGYLWMLDRAGAEIWRAAESGSPPAEIAARLSQGAREPEAVERDVWNSLSAWTHAGLLRRAQSPSLASEPDPNARASIAYAALAGDELRLAPTHRGRMELPQLDARSLVIRRKPDQPFEARVLEPGLGLQHVTACGLQIDPGLGEPRARQLLDWFAGLRYVDAMPIDPTATLPPRARADVLAEALEVLDGLLTRHGIWYTLIYGSLLGALRDGDVIPWDYDLDLLVRGEDLPRILPLSGQDDCVFEPIMRKGSSAPFNPGGLDNYFISAIAIDVRGRRVGELYCFHLFSDGVMRRFDPQTGVYWWPHSSFPHFLVEERRTLTIRGHEYPAPLHAEKWIEINYGADWRTPYRAPTQGGRPRAGSTDNSDRYAPRLREHIAWCEARGWNRAKYRDALAWPRTINIVGPFGATPRTRRQRQAMWYRSLDEVLHYY